MSQQDDLTRLGLYAVAPFVFGAGVMWLAPFVLPQWVALNVHALVLAYGGIVAAFLAGAAAATAVHEGSAARAAAPFAASAIISWFAIWPSGFLYFSVPAVWRYLILIAVFLWLGARDQSGPAWYIALRTRITFWTCVSLVLIMSRLITWRYF